MSANPEAVRAAIYILKAAVRDMPDDMAAEVRELLEDYSVDRAMGWRINWQAYAECIVGICDEHGFPTPLPVEGRQEVARG